MRHSLSICLPSMRGLIGLDCWKRPRRQQITINLCWIIDSAIATKKDTDDLENEKRLEDIAVTIRSLLESQSFETSQACAEILGAMAFERMGTDVGEVSLQLMLDKGVLGAAGCGISLRRTSMAIGEQSGVFFIQGLRLHARVGCEHDQREETQVLKIRIIIPLSPDKPAVDASAVIAAASQVVAQNVLVTIEAMATKMAQQIFIADGHISRLTLSIEKPNVLPFVEAAGVEVTMDRTILSQMRSKAEGNCIGVGIKRYGEDQLTAV